MKKRLVCILLSFVMIMSAVTVSIPAKASALDSDTLKAAGKGLIQKGVAQIPYVGAAASALLGPVLNKLFGISDTDVLEEIEKKLDQIDQKLDDIQAELSSIQQSITELSGKLDSSTQSIMNSIYQAKFGMSLDAFNAKLTSVAQITEQMYYEMDILYEDNISGYEVTSELYKTLRVAEMIKSFSNTTADEYVNMVLTLSRYLDGSQTASGGRGLFESVFLASCSNSVLGGEAAMIIAPYINEVTGTLSAAYKLLIIVDTCKLYVAEHYKEITAAAKEDSDTYDESIAALVEYGLESNYKDSLNKRLWKDLISNSNTSYITLHNYYFGETDSCVSRYNDSVVNHWFDYIQSCKFTNNDIQVIFFPLEKSLTGSSSSYKLPLLSNDVHIAENIISGYLDSGLGAANTKRLAEHVLRNENGVFVDTSSGNTSSTTEKTLYELLEDYGFEFPPDEWYSQYEIGMMGDSSKGPKLLVYGQSNTLGDWGTSTMRISGFDCAAKNGYYLSTGSLYSKLPQYDNYKYYADDYSHQMERFCIFYFFKPATVQIENEMDFESFILSLAGGRDYFQTSVSLNCDIDLSGIQYSALWSGLSEDAYNRGFRGRFSGNNHTIYGLTDTGDSHGAGLFRSIGDAGIVGELNFEDVNINVSTNQNAGVVAARVNEHTDSGETAYISNVHVKSGSITGGANAGGIIGYTNSGMPHLFNCKNSASIKAYGVAGGLIGNSQGTLLIRYSENSGDISSDTECAGGITGFVGGFGGEVNCCNNYGKVSAKKSAGGIIGDNESGGVNIVSCENKGVIVCSASRGQIVGMKGNNSPTNIDNCKENGSAVAASIFAGSNLLMICVMAVVVIAVIAIVIIGKKKRKL